jgi:hypothetical protein
MERSPATVGLLCIPAAREEAAGEMRVAAAPCIVGTGFAVIVGVAAVTGRFVETGSGICIGLAACIAAEAAILGLTLCAEFETVAPAANPSFALRCGAALSAGRSTTAGTCAACVAGRAASAGSSVDACWFVRAVPIAGKAVLASPLDTDAIKGTVAAGAGASAMAISAAGMTAVAIGTVAAGMIGVATAAVASECCSGAVAPVTRADALAGVFEMADISVGVSNAGGA